MRFHPTI